MEEKIDKLFNLFNDLKNKQLFSLSIQQILSIYNDHPATLYKILKNTNKLIYSKAVDPLLRLEHRQISAAIVERTYAIYCQRVVEFLSTSDSFIPQNLFHFDTESQAMEVEIGHTRDYELIRKHIDLNYTQIDFEYLIRDENVILGKDEKYVKGASRSENNQSLTMEQQRKLEEDVLSRMGISANFNAANFITLMEYMLGENQEIQLDESFEERSEIDSDEDRQGNYEKVKPVEQKFGIINPFNVIFNRAIYELVCPRWEYRHASALVLKSILRQNGFEFLDFKMFLSNIKDLSDIDQQVSQLGALIKLQLKGFATDTRSLAKKAQRILTRCLVVIAMDRFADYTNDQTHMLVRELACQISINLMTNSVWLQDDIPNCIDLLKRFVIVSRQSQTYEVCQSALFLIKGIYQQKRMETIPEEFTELLLELAGDNIYDEILTLVCEIWNLFLEAHLPSDYFQRTLKKVMKQIELQEEISYGSKAVFEYLTALFRGTTVQIESFEECLRLLKMIKKYFFHKINDVRISFFEFLQTISKRLRESVLGLSYTNIGEVQSVQKLLKQYALVCFQHNLLESQPKLIDSFSLSFANICLTLQQMDKNIKQHPQSDSFNDVFKQIMHLATTIANYKVTLRSPQLDLIRATFTSFADNSDFAEKNKDTILRLYENIYPQEVNFNHMEFQLLRIIKAAYILRGEVATVAIEDLQYKQMMQVGKWEISILIWLIMEVNFGSNLLGKDADYQMVMSIDQSSLDGEILQQMDRDVLDNMIILNGILKNYHEVERVQSNKAVIQQFLNVHTSFLQTKRKTYSQILQSLKQLGTIDYELRQQEVQKMQDSIGNLVESIIRFTKLSADIILNIQSFVIAKALPKVLKSELVSLGDILVQRLKVDKFDLIQDISAEAFVKICTKVQPQNQQQWFDQLFLSHGVLTPVHYVFQRSKDLKKKSYGRKRVMLQSFPYFSFQNYIFSEMNKLKGEQPISLEKLKINMWVIRMLQRCFVYGQTHGSIHENLTQSIIEIAQKVEQLLEITHAVLPKITEEESFTFQIDKKTIIFEAGPLKFKETIKKLHDQCLKILSVFFTTSLKYLSRQHNDSHFNEMFTKLTKFIITLVKNESEIIFPVLQMSLTANLQEFSVISPILILLTIKKLTSETVSEGASKLLGLLVPMLAVAQNSDYLKKVIASDAKLFKLYSKGLKFQEGFAKMTSTEYVIQGGLKPTVQLRDYQQEGIRWLGFLVKYNLNAALCDDMGLGKTLQTLTVIANEVIKKKSPTISLVIAPGTVVDHWEAEIKKYIDKDVLKPIILTGNCNYDSHNIWLVTYTQLLKMPQLLNKDFFFLVLDEAHLLKNNRNKSSKFVRQLKAQHKVVLSGTPVQNHLLELWALFDVLFPNYLGDEKYFKENFSKAFHTNLFTLTNDDLLFDEKQTQTLKLLHKKVLPFILRRTKQDVLPQLPPKIIQDYLCELQPTLQTDLYNLLDKNSFSQEVEDKLNKSKGDEKQNICQSVLKLLMMLRQVLDHPLLLKASPAPAQRTRKKVKRDDDEIMNKRIQEIFEKNEKPNSYHHSGKMIALKDILQQLGFNSVDDQPDQSDLITINQNKVLIFSRFKQALQLIAELLLKTQFPGLRYVTLDGSVPANERYPLVTRFNEDPDIRILLLTTQVGGLGLNLSSANIVVMFDHDYNPVNDQQAIDRAHRIGQRQTVQVYRLIVRDTLEERIMGIQRFKQAISKAIVNSDNASLQKMEQTDLLTLLETEQHTEEDQQKTVGGPFAKILSHFRLDQLEDMNFNKEY